jgi:hypothetical protein
MRAISIGLALMLAGCAGAYDWRRVEGGGAGLPVAAMRASSEVVTPPGRGPLEALAVRTFVPGGGPGGWDEVTGVTCRVEGAPYFAASVAPAFSWPEERRPSAPTRIWWGGGWWWGFEKTGPMRYPDLAVALR